MQLPALQVQPALALQLPAACRGVLPEQRHPVLPVSRPVRALPATSCPAVAWCHPDVRRPGDRRAGVRQAPLSELGALRASVLRLRAACRGVLPEQRRPVPALRPPASGLALYALHPVRASTACLAAAVLRRAAAGSVWDARVQPRAAASPASQQGVRGVRARPQAVVSPALRQVVRAVRARLPAAVPDARRAVPAVREPEAARDAVRLPEAVSALPVRQRAVRAAQALRAGSASRALRPAAELDGRAARLREAPADAARRPAVPDVRERPAPVLASAFRRGRALPLAAPVRRPAAKFVRATLRLRIASPSARSWRAARDEALSWYRSPRGGKSGQERK
ncbi:hypothetical protein ACVW17_001705 [Bradyrhizobium sp. USDA 4473]